MPRGLRAPLVAAALASAVPGCNASCATYVMTIVLEDDTSGELLCDARVTLYTGSATGDAGQVIDASAAPSDAEIPASSAACQWDVVVSGGTFRVTATAPGFSPGTATVKLPTDVCGSANAPVTVRLVRS